MILVGVLAPGIAENTYEQWRMEEPNDRRDLWILLNLEDAPNKKKVYHNKTRYPLHTLIPRAPIADVK